MKVELIGALDYAKVKELLEGCISDDAKVNYLLENIKDIEIARHSEIVSTAGRLSRFKGSVLEVLKNSEEKTIEQNNKFINFVIGMGHRSIIDHDYLVFALKDVSAIVEQMIIAERYSSFTIKSRREVDFSKSGYYVPDFHNENGELLSNNEKIKEEYKKHMDSLFNKYKSLEENGVKGEDARFILPYSFHSNIMMGIDAHTLLDMIIKYTKTKYAKVEELKEFGDKLYEIASIYTPYLIPVIDLIPVNYNDEVDEYLDSKIDREDYKIIDNVKLLNSSDNIDEQILISSIMRRYQYDYKKAKSIYDKLCLEDVNFKEDLMKKIAFNSDRLELSQVNFEFQIPVSYAILTHLTRHRTHRIVVPDFFPNIDLKQYKTPPKMNNYLDFYNDVFKENKEKYDEFKKLGIRDEDLIYFTLSGNMTNVLTNIDGWTVRHILELRECNKAQWETRDIANGMHSEIDKLEHAKVYSSVLGPTCMTQRICNEGKESCGKIKQLIKEDKKINL